MRTGLTFNSYLMQRMQILLSIFLIFFCSVIYAQQENDTIAGGKQKRKEWIKLGGSASIADNFYSARGIEPRQPANMLTGIFRADITLFDQITLPFELYVSTQKTRFQQPFNQFGVSPRIAKWLTLHAGYFSTQFSELSFGDLRMLGGGFELTPGKFRLKAIYGKSRFAVEPNTEAYMPGIYSQMAYAASIGYGDESKSFFNINLFHAVDDSGSIKRDSATVSPAENLVGTVSFGIQIIPALHIRGEVGASAFSGDITSETIDELSMPSFLFTPNISSRIDGAAKLSINITPSAKWSVVLSSQWIGPGFNSLGYALMPNDYMEYAVSPALRLLKNKLTIRSKAGIRFNNLRDHRIATTSRFTGTFSANWQVSKIFGFDINYNNNQIQSAHKDDTLRLSNIYSSASVSPRFLFNGFGGINNLIFTYSYQDVSDKNIYTSAVTNNQTHSFSAVHSLSMPSSWSYTTTWLYNNMHLSTLTSRIIHFSETISRKFFNNKMNAAVSAGMNFIKTTASDNQFVFRINAGYSLDKYGNFSFNLSNNKYNGTTEATGNYNEIFGSIQYNINF